MRPLLTKERIQKTGYFIFKNGRLLERQIFAYFFANGSLGACLKTLNAYQNDDGGFGNGLEPDLLCPDSTAIGAETALVVLDQLDCPHTEMSLRLFDWIASRQNAEGFIDYPPAYLASYPHQPWWANPDNERILSLAGIMRKWGVDRPAIFAGAAKFFRSVKVPEEISLYHYPYFLYLNYCKESDADREQFSRLAKQLPEFIEHHQNHFPLFSRYWYLAWDQIGQEIRHREAVNFVNAIHEDGDLDTPYPDYPWWRPIFLLDGLIQLLKMGYL